MATAFISSIPLILLLGLAAAHSNLGYPPAYSKQACKADTRCKTPCPPVRGNKRPVATWKRGETVDIVWHKNNHIGGFYRRSLVPVKHMMDHDWHKKTAFDFGCWSQGTFQCGRNEKLCGGDKKHRAYRNKVTIPSVFPDGEFVFAQVWYGGLQWQGRAPKYADYYSCSFVKISGGDALTASYTAKFQPNPKPKTGTLRGVPLDKCATGSIRPNQCGGEACENQPIINTVPEEFLSSRRHKVFSEMFGNGGMSHGPIREGKSDMVAETIQADNSDKAADEAVAREQELTTKKKSSPVANVLDEINVIIAGRKVGTGIEDGQSRIVSYNGGQVKFQIVTLHGSAIQSVVIGVSGEPTKTQQRKPYTYIWLQPKINKEVTLTARAKTPRGSISTMSVRLTLMNSSNNRNRNSSRIQKSCSKANEPPAPIGVWGPRGGMKWNRMRSMYWKRHRWCNRCRNCS